MKKAILVIVWVLISNFYLAHSQTIDYIKIYKFGLDADIKNAIPLIESYDLKELNESDRTFVNEFNERFTNNYDKSDYLKNHNSKINKLLSIYQNYWRKSLLANKGCDSLLFNNVFVFLRDIYPDVIKNEDSLDVYLKNYINSKGYYTTGFGRVGKLYDLLVWRAEKDTVYHIKNKVFDSKVRIVFMTDFVSLGWEEYATFGKYYPGGWAKRDKLYCVRNSYDINSEKYKVSYLAHEGQHFSDYKKFSDLTSYELEYRAKLVELSLADSTLFHLVNFFIKNSNKNSENGHSKANYDVISNLSITFFDIEFEEDIYKWEQLNKKRINKAALKLLKQNTHRLIVKKYSPIFKNRYLTHDTTHVAK